MTNSQPGSIDSVLVGQLEWLQAWTFEVMTQDADDQCRQLASTCQNLQGGLAAMALETLEAQPVASQGLPGLPNMNSPAGLLAAVQSGGPFGLHA